MKEAILVSACLLGTPCRYDGTSKPCEKVIALNERFRLVPVCPEVLGGLSTPRPPCERRDDKILRQDGSDMTPFYQKGANITLELAKKHSCKAAILKEKSPSCGSHLRYDGSFTKKTVSGMGLTTEVLIRNGIRVFSEEETDLL